LQKVVQNKRGRTATGVTWAKLDHIVIAAAIRQWRISVRQGRWWTFWARSPTFVTVLLVNFFVADVDDMNNVARFVNLSLLFPFWRCDAII